MFLDASEVIDRGSVSIFGIRVTAEQHTTYVCRRRNDISARFLWPHSDGVELCQSTGSRKEVCTWSYTFRHSESAVISGSKMALDGKRSGGGGMALVASFAAFVVEPSLDAIDVLRVRGLGGITYY
jgi:hypothetical protein